MNFKQIIRVLFLTLMFFNVPVLHSQDHPLGTITVLRMKNVNVSNENEAALAGFAANLNSALRATGSWNVPDSAAIQAALDDEGIDVNDLIELDDYFKAGKALKADYIVVGTVMQNLQNFLSQARVYSVKDKKFRGVVHENLSPQSLKHSTDQIASRVHSVVESATPVDSLYASFQWSKEFRFAFGPDRLDVKPPVVYFINDNPPFELSVKVRMDLTGGTYAVTEFDIYADDQVVAGIHPEILAPRTLREKTISLGGKDFCFRTEVKELRGRYGDLISSALIVISARYCTEN
ncbi:MAG: hypothetical protein WBD36_11370 [Bacteroidota bacterium]